MKTKTFSLHPEENDPPHRECREHRSHEPHPVRMFEHERGHRVRLGRSKEDGPREPRSPQRLHRLLDGLHIHVHEAESATEAGGAGEPERVECSPDGKGVQGGVGWVNLSAPHFDLSHPSAGLRVARQARRVRRRGARAAVGSGARSLLQLFRSKQRDRRAELESCEERRAGCC